MIDDSLLGKVSLEKSTLNYIFVRQNSLLGKILCYEKTDNSLQNHVQ